MEEPKRPSCAAEKKQVFLNIGRVSTHGVGGIGGVILLGGALATAAFASAFIIGKKRLSGSGDNNHLDHRIPPPPPPPAAVNKKDERDTETNRKEQFTLVDADKNSSSETTREIESKNDCQSFVLDEKHRIEGNGVAGSDKEASEQTLGKITPAIPENNAISNGDVSHLPAAQEQKTIVPLAIESMMAHDANIQTPIEAAIDKNAITEEHQGFEEVKEEGESRDDGAVELMEGTHGVECEDTKESQGNYAPDIDLKFCDEGTFVSELQGRDESSLPEFRSPISEQENVNGDEKQGLLSNEVRETIHAHEALEGREEDQVEHIEGYFVEQNEENGELDEEIIPRKGEEENDDQQSEGNNEEKGCIDNLSPENRQLGESVKDDAQILAMHLPEEDLIFPEEMEVSEEDAVNDDMEASFCQHNDTEDEVEKNIENEVEDSSEKIDTGIATAKGEEDIIDETRGDEDLSDEAEQNTEGTTDSSTESDFRGVWPAEATQEPLTETQQQELVNQEIEGKIQEDTKVRGKHEPYKIIADRTQITNGKCSLSKTFIERYVMDLATLKDYSTNAGTRKALVVAIPVLSSVSCSWFFGLSFDKLCLVVLLTVVLSKSMIVA